MFHGLLIGEVKGAELDLIADACDDASSCVDYPNVPVLHAQGKGEVSRLVTLSVDVSEPLLAEQSSGLIGHATAKPSVSQIPLSSI